MRNLSSPDVNDDNLEITFKVDSTKTANRTRGGVCLYFNENLPFINRDDLVNLDETILTEIRLKYNKIFFLLAIPLSKGSLIIARNFRK